MRRSKCDNTFLILFFLLVFFNLNENAIRVLLIFFFFPNPSLDYLFLKVYIQIEKYVFQYLLHFNLRVRKK